VEVKCPLIICESAIVGFLERGDTPGLQRICTVCPDPVVIWKKCGKFSVDASGSKSIGIVDASRVTKSIVDYKKIMGHNDSLQFNLVTNRG
jgi:hypothetical protein